MEFKQNHFASMRETSNVMRDNGKRYTVRANRDRFFFPDEWMAFYDALKDSQKMTFDIGINTGGRIMELQHIQVQDIDLDRGNIILRKTKAVRKGKSLIAVSKPRVLTISTQFTKRLKKYIKDNSLSPTDTLGILSTPAANIAMKKALKKAGIKDWDMFSFHTVRKSIETWLIALDVDSIKVINHFGHTLQVAAQHYVSGDIFTWDDKKQMRQIIGDLFAK